MDSLYNCHLYNSYNLFCTDYIYVSMAKGQSNKGEVQEFQFLSTAR